MRASMIAVGDRLVLKAEAEERYGLTGSFEVADIRRRNGYKTPWIYVRREPFSAILAFRPSDFARAVS